MPREPVSRARLGPEQGTSLPPARGPSPCLQLRLGGCAALPSVPFHPFLGGYCSTCPCAHTKSSGWWPGVDSLSCPQSPGHGAVASGWDSEVPSAGTGTGTGHLGTIREACSRLHHCLQAPVPGGEGDIPSPCGSRAGTGDWLPPDAQWTPSCEPLPADASRPRVRPPRSSRHMLRKSVCPAGSQRTCRSRVPLLPGDRVENQRGRSAMAVSPSCSRSYGSRSPANPDEYRSSHPPPPAPARTQCPARALEPEGLASPATVTGSGWTRDRPGPVRPNPRTLYRTDYRLFSQVRTAEPRDVEPAAPNGRVALVGSACQGGSQTGRGQRRRWREGAGPRGPLPGRSRPTHTRMSGPASPPLPLPAAASPPRLLLNTNGVPSVWERTVGRSDGSAEEKAHGRPGGAEHMRTFSTREGRAGLSPPSGAWPQGFLTPQGPCLLWPFTRARGRAHSHPRQNHKTGRSKAERTLLFPDEQLLGKRLDYLSRPTSNVH